MKTSRRENDCCSPKLKKAGGAGLFLFVAKEARFTFDLRPPSGKNSHDGGPDECKHCAKDQCIDRSGKSHGIASSADYGENLSMEGRTASGFCAALRQRCENSDYGCR
jgi:hypothetical protein